MQHSDTVLVFFGYGLASFAMGLVIVVVLSRAARSPLALALRWLAAFGILHGAAQWVLMAQLVKTAGVTVEGSILMRGLFLVLSGLSALALLVFGVQLLDGSGGRLRWLRWLPWALVGLWVLGVLVPQTTAGATEAALPSEQLCLDCHSDAAAAYVTASRGWVTGVDIALRYLLFVPAALLAAAGLAAQALRFRSLALPGAARESGAAAVTLVASGLVTGAVVPPGPYLPASVLNYATVTATIGFAPQLLWIVAAGALALFVVRMLGVFEVERRQQLEAAVIEERERIGREMHDGLAQALGYVGMRSSVAEELLDRNQLTKAREVIESIETAADEAYQDVRASILELRSSDVTERGLRTCVQEYCEKFALATGIAVDVEIDDGRVRRMSPLVELQVIRIVQEALANVRKHAHAAHASVRLGWSDHACVVSVSDDGRGFAPEASQRPGARFGLNTMRERAQGLGGALHVETAPGKGTTIEATIPHAERE
ncbi:MAG: sensor histidine kinase [Chloroflexota bacterium]|nr:sensor histidine kinase [Chloroflexota bacterium]MDE3193145.1 sensor histidine kinase [Chloroflexota bacterium]